MRTADFALIKFLFDSRRPKTNLHAMDTTIATTEAEIWGRAIRPDVGDLSADGARELLRLRLSDADAERVRQLSRKANAGTLIPDEHQELDHYLNVGRTLEFIKAKARRSLGDSAAA